MHVGSCDHYCHRNVNAKLGAVTLLCAVCGLQSDLSIPEQMSFASMQSADSLTSLDQVGVCLLCVFECTSACLWHVRTLLST